MSAGQGDGEDGSDVEAGNGKAQGQGVALEYIDVMLIHQPRPGPLGRARAWEALQRAKAEGWVKEIGVSNLYVPLNGDDHITT
jgi:diketogulonate reductase-like aldo/keto reductase